MHTAQADQVARLPDERRAGAARREPGVLEAGVLDLAHDVQPPVLRLPRLIPDALERNPHLDLVSPIGGVPARLKHEIGTQVGLLPSHDGAADEAAGGHVGAVVDRKSTRLNSSHLVISYAVFCLKKKTPAPHT